MKFHVVKIHAYTSIVKQKIEDAGCVCLGCATDEYRHNTSNPSGAAGHVVLFEIGDDHRNRDSYSHQRERTTIDPPHKRREDCPKAAARRQQGVDRGALGSFALSTGGSGPNSGGSRSLIGSVKITDLSEFFTASMVRLRPGLEKPGTLNWLFLPGGPGIGSESLEELVRTVALPGRSWLVDLPGDGSNLVDGDPFRRWPSVLLEAAEALPDTVFVGHSTGAMYLLSVPELEERLRGLVLISSAPDARWYSRYLRMAAENPLVAMQAANRAFEAGRNNETLRDLAVASAPWNFSGDALHLGEALLARMPYNLAAVEWSDSHFDHSYALKWWPKELPTLIVSGSRDRIVAQDFWDDARFAGSNVARATIENAGHFPWIEQPDAVREAFAAFVGQLGSAGAEGNDPIES